MSGLAFGGRDGGCWVRYGVETVHVEPDDARGPGRWRMRLVTHMAADIPDQVLRAWTRDAAARAAADYLASRMHIRMPTV